MATRKRRPLDKNLSASCKASRNRLRRSLLEQLEQRQLLAAGPQLIGVQPNQGSLIDTGVNADPATQLSVAPRVLTFRFDDGQEIHPSTLDAIRITRAGDDGSLGTSDDVTIDPGSVLVNNPASNEVLVRFAGALPDDRYRVEVFGFDDPARGIVGLRNTADDGSPGQLLQPRTSGARTEVREFELRLGALVESIVPQPVVRLGDGSLEQRRDQVVVYFNEPLFIEADPGTGEPTDRSADNPRFYQLLFTQDSVRNTDDFLFLPTDVAYDDASQTATLTFAKDLELLIRENLGAGIGGGTYRLRIGSAVNLPAGADGTMGVPTYVSGDPAGSIDLFFEPDSSQQFVSSAQSSLRTSGDSTTVVDFVSLTDGQGTKWNQVRFENSGAGGLSVSVTETANYFDIVVDLGGPNRPTVDELIDLLNDPNVANNDGSSLRISASVVSGSGSTQLGSGLPAMEPIRLLADSFSTAYDVGVLGGSQVTSLIFDETISAVPYSIDSPGGPNDPAARDLVGRQAGLFGNYINASFDVDLDDQIKLVQYNFGELPNGVENSITGEMKDRVREALDLWNDYVGVNFVETMDEGITIGLGTPTNVNPAGRLLYNANRAAVVPDATLDDGLLVLDALFQWKVGYGQDFFRTSFAGVGALLGLGQASDLPTSTVMALSNAFLNGTIDQSLRENVYNQVGNQFTNRPLEPVFPGNYDIQHASYLHGLVGSDIDLYQFEVDVTTGSNTGVLTAETFAQRLPDSSTLDTSLKLFKQTQASVETNFSIPVAPIRIEAIAPGRLGNETQIDFVRSFRSYIPPNPAFTPAEEAQRQADNAAEFEIRIVQTGINSFTVDLPYLPNLGLLDPADQAAEQDRLAKTPADIVYAIQGDAFASSLVRVIDVHGDNFALLDDFEAFEPVFNLPELPFKQLVLTGGDIAPIAFNDDYFGTDSRIQLQLEDGIYYIGVSASGNDQYDPVIPGTGYGGGSEGDYQLFVKFEANADGRDTIRDVDGDQVGVPGTPLDGDGDGIPGGANSFWFQVRPEVRQVEFTAGSVIVPGSTMTIVSGPNSQSRTYQFREVDQFGSLVPGQPPLGSGNIPILYRATASSNQIADLVAAVVNSQSLNTQVTAVTGDNAPGNVLGLDNERSVSFSSNFRGANVYGRTLFVDKAASAFPDGTTESPFNNIANAAVSNVFGVTHPDDIVRIVGNGGNDGRLETAADNFAYRIGFAETGGLALEDGTTMDVPKGVTVMIDAGAIFKLRNARIGVGSSNLQLDRSGSSMQVLGTPRLLDSTGSVLVDAGQPVVGNVVFTSSRDRTVAQGAPGTTLPSKGDWGGIALRRDVDDEFGRLNLEDQGIFLNHINFADIRYGGGSNVLVDANQVTVNPIQIIDSKPTVTFNRISQSADAAMSAAPNSFEEVSYQAPRYQGAGAFTADYDRVGPDIRSNRLVDNSLNGLFIRVETRSGEDPVEQVVSGRWDDIDIVHILSENLILAGNAGGAIRDDFAPELNLLTTQVLADAGSVQPGTYRYRMTFVDALGFESLASDDTSDIVVTGADSRISLAGLPQVGQNSDYRFRRLYRSLDGGDFQLVTELNASDTMFVDALNQDDATSVLDLSRSGERGRLASSLVIDPGTVVKIQGSRIEVGFGARMMAEGTLGKEVVFTSIQDDRYGAGGSFDTNNDGVPTSQFTMPSAGDWSGIYGSPSSHISLDHAVVAYAGGLSRIEGTFKAFNPIELQQSSARIVNTVFEDNADGIGGQGPTGRFGRLANTPATIFVRGAEPIIVGNTFVDNRGSVIDIDVNSISAELNVDVGRQTGALDRIIGLDDNRGPLVRRNVLDNNQLNGMEIRGETLTTESVWDDTDIVHVLYDSVVVDNFHGSGGLRLQSNPNESLVVKLFGEASPFNDTTGTGFTITGTENDLSQRIGGSLQILGRPGFPVVLTSLRDDTVGAGRKPDGTEQTDTNNDQFVTRPRPNDWRSVFLDQTSNDRNVKVVRELELQTDQAPGSNGTAANAQVIGEMAGRAVEGDDLRRIGFDVEGFLSEPTDLDVYQFTGEAGSEVWIDIDRTTSALDAVVELLDANGQVLARSVNSYDEVFDASTIQVFSSQLDGRIGSLVKGPTDLMDTTTGGDYFDFGSTNPRDAGMRVVLPGAVGSRGPYFVRVRSNSVNVDDAEGGLTSGLYRMQIRLGEAQEFAGSSVNYADIRYANTGVHAKGLPGSSPLLGDAQEDEQASSGGLALSNDSIFPSTNNKSGRPQYLGNLLSYTDRTVSVGGALSFAGDVDFYQVDLNAPNTGATAGGVVASAAFDIDYADGISRPDTNMAVYYSPSGTPAGARLVLFAEGSNITEDRRGFLASASQDIFNAGSTGAGDPFIGPAALPEGTYYVGITHASRVPTVLSNETTVRREPVNSVRRLVEERFYGVGDTVVLTSAEAPVVSDFFDAGALPSGWGIDLSQSGAAGHGIPSAYDGSRNVAGGGRSLRYNPGINGPNTTSTIDSAEFSLLGYSAEDKPYLYFNYMLSGGPTDNVQIQVVSSATTTTIASSLFGANRLQGDGVWRQARIALDQFEYQEGLTLRVVYNTGGQATGTGFFLDDIVIGFAERGEMVLNAAPGTAYGGGPATGVTNGEYQLEIRPATNYFSNAVGFGRQITLDTAYDTNDRHAESITYVAPAGADIQDGMYFRLGDGSRLLTFEFDELTPANPNGTGVTFGNIRIPFRSADSPEKVATVMRAAINAAVDQNSLRIKASTAFGGTDSTPSDARINLYGPVSGDFVSITTSTVPVGTAGGDPLHVRMPARFSNGIGDVNAERLQGQIIIDSNFISDTKAFGIRSDGGDRMIDPADLATDTWHETYGMHSSYLGAVRNLPTTNEDVTGGLAPGLVIQNNVIDQPGYVGVSIEGKQNPLVIDAQLGDFIDPEIDDLLALNHPYFGSFIPDGLTFAIDAGGTRVVFEFEDVSGTDRGAPWCGDVQPGGRGWTAGHVPVFYRVGLQGSNPYLPPTPSQRVHASSRQEVMHAIRDAIIGSILVTNDTVPLVDVWVGDSLFMDPTFSSFSGFTPMSNPLSSVYIDGASGVYWTNNYAACTGSPFTTYEVPVHQVVQPFARVINNTIYGADGTESNFPQSATDESNDQLNVAIDTKQGAQHSTGPYTATAVIGDSNSLSPSQDVDLYRFNLDVGDRVLIDVSTLVDGPDATLRLFNSQGVVQLITDANGDLVDLLTTGTAPGTASIDFTALAKDSYYIGVSSTGNDEYDPQSFADRVDGTGGTGQYDISIEVLAPRQFVLSLQGVTQFENLIGGTFTIDQVPDLAGQTTNSVTFEFVTGGGVAPLANGNIPVNIITSNDETGYRTSDVMRAIAGAINGVVNGSPRLPNHELQNGPFGASGPITRVEAVALGGADGWDQNTGLTVYDNGIRGGVQYPIRPAFLGILPEAPGGFGHNRIAQVNSVGINGTFTDGAGTTENYVLIKNAHRMTVNAPNLGLDPQPGRTMDQLISEVGVMARNGASPSLMNNVIVNTQAAVETEVTRTRGFGSQRGANLHPKPGQVIVGGSIFQYTEDEQTLFQSRMNWPAANGAGTETDAANIPSNVNGGTDDFNILLPATEELFVNAPLDNFVPQAGAISIDSSLNSLAERDAFASLKRALGLPVNPLLAPNRDATGQLRVDDPEVFFTGLGSNVFKDRGALDRADFIGPVAVIINPFDNDSEGNDQDPNVSFVQIEEGIVSEFRIQLRDSGDASDPFQGSGVDDSTVSVSELIDLRGPGAVVTLFENGVLLEEGVDYLFSYDQTNDIITLRPIAGIWRQESVYEIGLNNRDRFVAIAPAGQQVIDGEQFVIHDDVGGRVTFEYDSGYQLQLPEVVTLGIPAAGTATGGIADGDRVTIDDGSRLVTFEYTTDLASVVPGNIPVLFNFGDSPTQLITALNDAIQTKIDDGTFVRNVPGVGNVPSISLALDGEDKLRIGMQPDSVVNASASGLIQAGRTLALLAPIGGVGPAGVVDGDTFIVSDGLTTQTFEFDNDATFTSGNIPVDITGVTQPTDVIQAIANALATTNLQTSTRVVANNLLYLGLPEAGNAVISSGRLAAVSLAQTMGDGGTITMTPSGGTPVVFELNRTDEPTGDDGVAFGNVAINFTETTSANELANLLTQAVENEASLGLSPTAPGSGIVSLGGDETLQVGIAGEPNIQVTGRPGVEAGSTITIFGPLLIQTPLVGGNGIPDGSTFSITSGGNTAQFEFNQFLTPPAFPNAITIGYDPSDTPDVIATAIAAAINGSGLGVTATPFANGEVSLGQVADGAVILETAPITTRRGVVTDGETVVISEEGQQLTFEFEEATTGGGLNDPDAIRVLFNAGDTIDQVAESLAAAIRIAGASLGIGANAVGNGDVVLVDTPRTRVDVSGAPTLSLGGAAGSAIPVNFVQAASFDAEDMKRAILEAINTANERFGKFMTSLTAVDRGGDTLFIENAISIDDPIVSFYLSAIKDLNGEALKPNRADGTTRFTLMLPTVDFDYGDAPDPQGTVVGRYPTLASSDGARHVFGVGPILGTVIDAESNGQPLIGAIGDDAAAYVVGTPSPTFVTVRSADGLLISLTGTPQDGDTIRIATVSGAETFELDSDNIFSEDNIPVRFLPGDTVEQIAGKLGQVILGSPLGIGAVNATGTDVMVVSDDDDGVRFDSATNPFGIFNRNITTEVTVTVTGQGFVDGWIDFNADGDWDDPGEQILVSHEFDGSVPTLTFLVDVPSTTPVSSTVLETYARFRVSSTGGLAPSGLAIDGEVEDYRVRIVPGSPPVVGSTTLGYTVDEDQRLIGIDADGTATPTANDNGLLAQVTDPDGDVVEVYPNAGVETINGVDYMIVGVGTTDVTMDGAAGGTTAGTLTVNADGRFTFDPAADYFGEAIFRLRVQDRNPAGQADLELVAPDLITVTIDVAPVNDAPVLIDPVNDTVTVVDLPEDQVLTLTGADLVDGYFQPGPANESAQAMRVQTAGFGGVPNVTKLGGTLQVTSTGEVIYTPPADYNGPDADEFVYTVVDEPPVGQSPQQSTDEGTVVITFVAVNDPPTTGPNTFSGFEDTPLQIGVGTVLGNDSPGPQDEIDEGQFVSLVDGQFPLTTVRGGEVTLSTDGLTLIYTPRQDFDGSDSFQYQVTDNAAVDPQTAFGTVTINLTGVNDGAIYGGPTSLTYNESKGSPQTFDIDLDTWFTDPEGDALTYDAFSSDSTLLETSLNGNILTITLPVDQSGDTSITVTASNPGGLLPTTEVIPVTVINTPDPPRVIASLNPTNTDEDVDVVRDLTQYFEDPDGDTLTYTVVTPAGQADPFDRSLIESVTFNGDQMVITLVPDASGSTNVTLRVSDGTFSITETFAVIVAPVADVPVSVGDSYSVPVRGRLTVADPRLGLLANDTEADGDAFTVDVGSLTQPSNGTVSVNPDGTFTYTSISNAVVGATDSFTYRAIDQDGAGNRVTVLITLTASTHQNPNNRLDVNADGDVSPIDALRIVNLLNRTGQSSIPIRDLPAPPDYFDTDGNGTVAPLDALGVINFLNRSGSGEGESSEARFGATVAWASAGTQNLPQTAIARGESFTDDSLASEDERSTRWEMVDGHLEDAIESMVCQPVVADQLEQQAAADEALVGLMEEFDLGSRD